MKKIVSLLVALSLLTAPVYGQSLPTPNLGANTMINGVKVAPSATIDTTNGANIKVTVPNGVNRTILTSAQDTLRVADFGADFTGTVDICSTVWPAIQTALTSYPNGTNIVFKGGTILASCQLVLPANKSFHVYGQGHSTQINFTGTLAGFSASENSPNFLVEIDHFMLIAGANTTTPAVYINYSTGASNQHGPSVHDLWISGSGNNYAWYAGVQFNNAFYGSIRDVVTSGNTNSPGTAAGVSSNNTFGCYVLSGQSPGTVIDHDNCLYAQNGVAISGDSEGTKISNSEMVAVNVGYLADGTNAPNAPSLTITNSHSNSYLFGVKLIAWNQATISNNLFYKISNATTAWSAIGLKNTTTSNGTVVGSNQNTVVGNFGYGFGSGTQGGAFFVDLDTSATNNTVQDNIAENMNYVVNGESDAGTFYFTGNKAYDTVGGWIANPPIAMLSSGNMPEDAGSEPSFMQLAAGATTINLGATIHKSFHTANTATTTITNITGGNGGDIITINPQDSNTTIQNNGAPIYTCALANVVMTFNKARSFRKDGSVWREIECN